jgi:hypothetical protein
MLCYLAARWPPILLPHVCGQGGKQRQSKGRAKAEYSVRTALEPTRASPIVDHAPGEACTQSRLTWGDTHGRAPAAMETAATVAPLSTRLLDTLSPALACSVHTDDAVCARRASGGRAVGVNASATSSKHSPAETETNTSLRVPWPGHCITKPGSCHVVLARGTCTACGMRSSRSDSSDVLAHADYGCLCLREKRTRRRHMPSQRKQLASASVTIPHSANTSQLCIPILSPSGRFCQSVGPLSVGCKILY